MERLVVFPDSGMLHVLQAHSNHRAWIILLLLLLLLYIHMSASSDDEENTFQGQVSAYASNRALISRRR